jgi:hypothetical protein
MQTWPGQAVTPSTQMDNSGHTRGLLKKGSQQSDDKVGTIFPSSSRQVNSVFISDRPILDLTFA